MQVRPGRQDPPNYPDNLISTLIQSIWKDYCHIYSSYEWPYWSLKSNETFWQKTKAKVNTMQLATSDTATSPNQYMLAMQVWGKLTNTILT